MARKVDKEKKKEEIILAALKVFAQKGFYKTKIADIAAEAGIGKGTIYEYFRTKEEILGKGFEFLFKEMDTQATEFVYANIPPSRKLETLIKSVIEEFLKFGEGLVKVLMDFWAEGIRSNHPDILGSIDLKTFYDKFRNIIASIIQEGIDKGEFIKCNPIWEASLLIASMDGLMLQWITYPGIFSLEEMEKMIIDHFLGYLKNK